MQNKAVSDTRSITKGKLQTSFQETRYTEIQKEHEIHVHVLKIKNKHDLVSISRQKKNCKRALKFCQ